MPDLDKAILTQLANIEKRSGKSLAELEKLVLASGLEKHGEVLAMLKTDLGLGHGDANTIAHYARKTSSFAPVESIAVDSLVEIYSGPKAALRPIHEKLLTILRGFGDFEEIPKKGYMSLRRKKQFATVGPATNSRVDVGLNMKGVPATARLEALPPKGMCQYRVKLTSEADVDDELIVWVRIAFDAAG
jgi:hypothetical protein